MNRILVATDGSPPSAEAAAVAIELASEHRSELTFVHVVPRLDVVAAGDFTEAFPHEPTEHDQVLLEDAAALAAEHGIVATTALRYGATVEEIIDLTLALGRRTNPAIRCGGASFNTSALDEAEARALMERESERLGLPVADPIRGGPAFDALVASCLA